MRKQRVDEVSVVLPKPLVLYHLTSMSKLQCTIALLLDQLLVAPSQAQVRMPPCEAMHVIFEAPKFITRGSGQTVEASPLIIVVQFHALAPDDRSTQFLQIPTLT